MWLAGPAPSPGARAGSPVLCRRGGHRRLPPQPGSRDRPGRFPTGPVRPSNRKLTMSDRVVIERHEMDRLVLMRRDLDRYEAQLIPDLQRETLALYHALRTLVVAVREAEQLLKLEATLGHRGALRVAERLLLDLEQRREEPTGLDP